MEILKFEDLPQGGFAGLRERRFVMDQRVFGARKGAGTADGIGNFVYLADANFMPKGETGLHPHHEIDVISVMVDGRVSHAGSMEHGQALEAGMVQVQRAGAEGFSHNEINPDDTQNHMIQIWVAPDEPGEPAGYKSYTPKMGDHAHVYGGPNDQNDRFYSKTQIKIVNATAGQTVSHHGEVMAYLSKGSGTANGQAVNARTLMRTDGIEFQAGELAQLILIHTNN